jgi:replication factor C large subunit
MTANDISLDKLSSLIKKSEILEFGEISSKGINERLGEICEKENIEMDDFMLKSIASRAGGDLRAAINDLQTLRNGNKDDLNLIGDRKREEDLNNILRLIFKSKDIKLIENSLGDIKLDELQSWIQSNVVYEYDEIDKAFNYLSKADVFKGRIRKWQYWRFLVYQKFFMSSGVALSKEKKSTNIIKYKRPSIGLMIWQSNMRNSKRKSISKKIAFHFKISEKRAFQMFPDVVSLIKLNNIQKKLGLE